MQGAETDGRLGAVYKIYFNFSGAPVAFWQESSLVAVSSATEEVTALFVWKVTL